jgi:hypothetical protein
MNDKSFFPIMIRGVEYFVIQKKNILEISYDDENEDEEVPEEEAEIVINYLIDEGFIK